MSTRTIDNLRSDPTLFGETAAEADEIFIAFAELGSDANLTEWMERYPEQATELARYSADQWIGDSGVSATVVSLEERFTRISSEVLRSLRPASATPFESLIDVAAERNLNPNTLAELLNLPIGYIAKLHRRLFAPDSIPATLITALADALDRAAEEVQAYLRLPPVMAAGASYRSDSAPSLVAQEDFGTVLAADEDLTDEQRSRWLSVETGSESSRA